MSGVKKTARKIHKKVQGVVKKVGKVDPFIGAIGKLERKVGDRVERWTDKNIWDPMEPQVPEVQDVASAPVMPIPDDSGAEIEARRRRARSSRSGRESTILTGLGG